MTCVSGDGEAETGPLAAAWHSNKFLDRYRLVMDVIHRGPGVKRAMTRLGAREHITFGGCLEQGAKGWGRG